MQEQSLTPEYLAQWLPVLIREGVLWRFYKTAEWQRLRQSVLAEYHGECAWCAAASPSRVVPAEAVHHLHEVKRFPAWALQEFVTLPDGQRVRNLVPLCHDCHDRAHQRMEFRPKPAPLTEERW